MFSSIRRTVQSETFISSAISACVYSLEAYICHTCCCCRADNFGCLPRNLPFFFAIASAAINHTIGRGSASFSAVQPLPIKLTWLASSAHLLLGELQKNHFLLTIVSLYPKNTTLLPAPATGKSPSFYNASPLSNKLQ